jgi:ABC-2 type transport system permease protein
VSLEAPAPIPSAGAVSPEPGDNPSSTARASVQAQSGRPREDAPKVTRVVSAEASLWRRVGEIWHSRELLIYLVRTEIKVKYKNSVLGLVWSMIAPALTLVVYTVIFAFFLKNGIPNFVIFLFSGLLLWNLFQTGVTTATGVVVNNAGLVKKVSFPREILALAAVGSAGVFFFFQSCVMVLFMLVLGVAPAWELLWLLPVALIPALVLASALALLLSSVNVYLRDTQHLVEVVVGSAWFWACPIVYSYQGQVAAKLSAHGLKWLYFANPMTPLVMTFQRVLYNRTGLVPLTTPHPPGHPNLEQILPSWGAMTYVGMDAIVLAVAVTLFFVALVVFGRLAGNFAEEL